MPALSQTPVTMPAPEGFRFVEWNEVQTGNLVYLATTGLTTVKETIPYGPHIVVNRDTRLLRRVFGDKEQFIPLSTTQALLVADGPAVVMYNGAVYSNMGADVCIVSDQHGMQPSLRAYWSRPLSLTLLPYAVESETRVETDKHWEVRHRQKLHLDPTDKIYVVTVATHLELMQCIGELTAQGLSFSYHRAQNNLHELRLDMAGLRLVNGVLTEVFDV